MATTAILQQPHKLRSLERKDKKIEEGSARWEERMVNSERSIQRPFEAMEMVNGKIGFLEFFDSREENIDGRARLFELICRGVMGAQGVLIIQRLFFFGVLYFPLTDRGLLEVAASPQQLVEIGRAHV